MNKIVKKLYYLLPFKREIYSLLRKVYSPGTSLAGYLKFTGSFVFVIEKVSFRIYNRNLTIPTLLFWKGINGYEPLTLITWMKLSEQASIVFDVGANFGLFGLITKSVNRNCSVHCFEPLKRNSTLIEINSKLNGFDIHNCCAAVSDKEGTNLFYDMDSYDNTIGSFNKEFVNKHKHHTQLVPIKVDTITLDRYAERNSISKIDLLKIDVEGHELEVLQGALDLIRRGKPQLVIEITDETTWMGVVKVLRSIHPNYRFYVISEFKGLIEVMEYNALEGRNILACVNG